MAIVLITGTASGIGLATAIACATHGFDVIATMRDLGQSEQLLDEVQRRGLGPRSQREDRGQGEGGGVVHVEQLDVTARGVGPKVRELVLKYGPMECLVNNARMAVGGVFEETSESDLREQFETNVFGLMAVTRAVLPSMRANRRGRIVNVSSISGRIGLPGVAVYAATKHAVSGFSEALRHEVAALGIDVCLMELGTLKGLIAEPPPRDAHEDERTPYRELTRAVTKLLLDAAQATDEPEVVAERIVALLREESPPFRTVLGHQARAAAALKRVAPDRLFGSALRRLMGL